MMPGAAVQEMKQLGESGSARVDAALVGEWKS